MSNEMVLTILGMLIEVDEMGNLNIEVDGFMIRRFVCKAKPVYAFLLGHKLVFFASFFAKFVYKFVPRAFNLVFLKFSR